MYKNIEVNFYLGTLPLTIELIRHISKIVEWVFPRVSYKQLPEIYIRTYTREEEVKHDGPIHIYTRVKKFNS